MRGKLFLQSLGKEFFHFPVSTFFCHGKETFKSAYHTEQKLLTILCKKMFTLHCKNTLPHEVKNHFLLGNQHPSLGTNNAIPDILFSSLAIFDHNLFDLSRDASVIFINNKTP